MAIPKEDLDKLFNGTCQATINFQETENAKFYLCNLLYNREIKRIKRNKLIKLNKKFIKLLKS